jgi:sigma-54 specific flagellar transcriptional regulator A
MPSLRSRIEDLPTLIEDFAVANVAAGRARVQLSEAALDCLRSHAWPGNVRELGNLVERLSILCAGRPVTSADLPPRYRPAGWSFDPARESLPEPVPAPPPAAKPTIRTCVVDLSEREALMVLEAPVAAAGNILPPEGIDLRLHVSGIEESLIRQALDRSDGIVAQAARLLGLRRTTLVEKLRKYDLGTDVELPED